MMLSSCMEYERYHHRLRLALSDLGNTEERTEELPVTVVLEALDMGVQGLEKLIRTLLGGHFPPDHRPYNETIPLAGQEA